jgi:tetratricopeptide (TPR) repeat protein
MRRLAVLAAAAALSCGHAQVVVDRTALGRAMPAELDAGSQARAGRTRAAHDAKVARIRVLADADYRAADPHWKQHVTDDVDYANQLLIPLLGVRLTITEVRAWPHHAPHAPLRVTLGELARADPGDGVHWVLGLTAPPDHVTTDEHELGTSALFGRYLVVRGYAAAAEEAAVLRAFPDLPRRSRRDVLDARRRHKETVVLVHALAHTLGAIHETDPSWIVHAEYDPSQSTVSDRNRELMQIAIADRLKIKELRAPLATARAVLAAIEKADWGGWVGAEHDDEVSALRAIIDAARAGETAADVPAAAYDQYARARSLAERGQLTAALTELQPLIAAYPGNAQIRLLACRIELGAVGPAGPAARDTCTRAAELAPGDPGPYLVVAGAMIHAGDKPGARGQLALAAGRIPNLEHGRPAAWAQLAGSYQQLGDLTRAEDAAAKADAGGAAVAAWAAQIRARYGAPRDGRRFHLGPDDEAAYVDAIREVLDLGYAGKLAEAGRAARAADRRWPGSPGIAAARCDLELRAGHTAAARARCKAALAADPGDSWALYLSGLLELQHRDPAPGIATLERAIAADPDLAQAWHALAQAYARTGGGAPLDQLRADYQKRFGQPLAP